MSVSSKESGLLMSLTAWGMCAGIHAKIFWVVLLTWMKLICALSAFVWHGFSGTLLNSYAVYSLAVLGTLTWVLYKTIPLQKEARIRSMKLLRAGIDLGPA